MAMMKIRVVTDQVACMVCVCVFINEELLNLPGIQVMLFKMLTLLPVIRNFNLIQHCCTKSFE